MRRGTGILTRMRSMAPPAVWLLGVAAFINIGGLSFLWPVNAIYIHTVLGKPLSVAGMVLMVYSGAGLLGSFFSGWMYDRTGPIPVLSFGLAASAAAICIPVFDSRWWTYVGVMVLFGFACAIPIPALGAMVAHVWPEGGRQAFNFLYVANNLGVAAGTALGGVLAEHSFRDVFLSISCSYLTLLVLVLAVFRHRFRAVHPRRQRIRVRSHASAVGTSAIGSRHLDAIPWGLVSVILAGFVLSWAVYVQWQSLISVYMRSLGYALSAYSALWTLNGLLIFLAQPLVARVVRKVPSLAAQMAGGVVLFAIAYGLLLLSHRYMIFVAAMMVMTGGELFVWPAVPAAIARISPSSRLGLLQGLVGSGGTLGRMIGPVAGGILYDHVSMTTVLTVIMLALCIPFLLFLLSARLHRTSVATAAAHQIES